MSAGCGDGCVYNHASRLIDQVNKEPVIRRQAKYKWHFQRSYRRMRRFVFSYLYRDTNQDMRRSILVAGTGRSGTTWIGDIFASQLSGRIVFEPFHSRKVAAFNQYHYFQYMRPNEQDEMLATFCRRVFTGNIRDKWMDDYVEVLRPEFRIVKEIRANLFLKWIQNRFPQVPLIFVVRHPCAVVWSRMALKWDTDRDIASFLAQPKLVEDFLGEKMDVIERANSPEEKHAVIWCISNLVPLQQFQQNELNIVFYEHLCTRPEIEIPRLFQAIQLNYQDSVFTILETPSMTSRSSSAIVAREDRLSRWKNKLNVEQIDRILKIVAAFSLDHLYGESLTPKVRETATLALGI